jgi:hypothetical protein
MSSSQQQHVINMTGLDSGPVTTSISGAHSINQSMTPALSTSTSSSSTTQIPPGAYRSTSSQHSPRLQQSVYAPLSPSHNPSAYALPTLTALSPMSATATSSLNRSQSLNTAAYQQMHGGPSQQQQQAYGPSSSSSMYPQQPNDASVYRNRELNQPSYSEGSSSGALLPTINTHIPRNSLMGSPYSPSLRQSMALDPQSYNPGSAGPPKSPVTRQQGSPYIANPNNRPGSMYDVNYGRQAMSSPRNNYHPVDSRMSPAHRASPSATPQLHKMGSNQRLRASEGNLSGLPTHLNTSTLSDALPLYRNPSEPLNQMHSSPYMQSSTTLYGGAPPRTSGVGGSYDQMNMEPAAGPSNSHLHRDRRGTFTSVDATGMLDNAAWDRQRRTVEAAEMQQPPRPKIQEGFRRVRDVSDLKAVNEPAIAGTGRRADPSGGYVSVSACRFCCKKIAS